MKKVFKNKVVLLLVIGLILTGCFASSGNLVNKKKIRPGMNKLDVMFVFAFQSVLENPFLPTSYREYFREEKKEILSDDNDKNIYYVFEYVYKPVTCGFWVCKEGDGRLAKIAYNYSDARNYIKKDNKKSYQPKKTVTIVEKGQTQELSSDNDTLAQIKKLAKDYQDGKLTEEQFEKKKKELLK